jgi:hypothetical protein
LLQMMVILIFNIKAHMEVFQKMFGRDHKMIIIVNSLLLLFEIEYHLQTPCQFYWKKA